MLTLIAWAFILSFGEGTGQAPETLDKYKLSTFFHAFGRCRVIEEIPFAFFNNHETMAKKLQLGYREIEARLITPLSPWRGAGDEVVGYNLLYSFGKSERNIERYKEGKGVLKTFDGLLIKGLFCYQPVSMFGLTSQLEQLKANIQIIKAAPKIPVCPIL